MHIKINFYNKLILFYLLLTGFLIFSSSCSTLNIKETDQGSFNNPNINNETRSIDSSKLEKLGCLTCHSMNNTNQRGPTFKAIFGKTVSVIEGSKEKEIIVDEEYLKTSILEPDKQIVKGFKPVMASYADELSEEDLNQIIKILKELK